MSNEKGQEGVGPYLRQAREARGLSLEELAQATKIRKTFLEALENEDWESLPAEIYVRGYVRCYAEVVGLNPEEVLKRLPSGGPSPFTSPESQALPLRSSWKSRPEIWLAALGLLIGLIFLVYYFWP